MAQGSEASSRERGEAFLREFIASAQQSRDLFSAYTGMMEPDCRVYAENGQTYPPSQMLETALISRVAFPDLTADLDHAWFIEDRVVLQVTFTSTTGDMAPAGLPSIPSGLRTSTRSAIVGRPNERLRLTEVWNYLNPAFPFTYPPTGQTATPPLVEGVGIEEARRLFQRWEAGLRDGQDFISAVADSLAPDGVVHLGNGDDGHADTLLGLFRVLSDALENLTMEIETVLPGDGCLVAQFTMSGRHVATLGPYAPSGRVLPSRGMLVARPNREARLAELWVYVAPVYAIALPPED